ncbi:MAG: zeta toxin family protein [Eubacterium sp.]|nr:zeta toxin family protein [Eubacterium sp.]
MKKYVIFAGVNGAGKTTLYQTNEEYLDLPRINLDEIVRGIGSWKNSRDISEAGIIAVREIRRLFDEGRSFNQETTLCGHSIFRNIFKAKELGYSIELSYVGLRTAEIAIERVAQRVRDGGHGIPEEDIRRRYNESLINLKKIIPFCDRARIYDNTQRFGIVAVFNNGVCVDRIDDIPDWCDGIV